MFVFASADSLISVTTLVTGALLFVVGLIGFVTRRSLVSMLFAWIIVVQGALLSLAAADLFHGKTAGEVLAVIGVTVAAAQAVVVWSLVGSVSRSAASPDVEAKDEP